MISVKNFSFSYNNQPHPSLNGINLTIKQGGFILLTGGSGSGKTTFLRALNGLVPHFYGGIFKGDIQVDHKSPTMQSPREMASSVGFVFQNTDNQLFRSDVRSEIVFGMENLGLSPSIMEERLKGIQNSLGLTPLMNRSVSSLSGGEKQKVAIASVLAMNPKIILLDEPISELDSKNAAQTLDLLAKLNQDEQITIILVEHRLQFILPLVSRIILFDAGKIQADCSPQDFFRLDLRPYPIEIPPIMQFFLSKSELQDPRVKNGDYPIPITQKQACDFLLTVFTSRSRKKRNAGANLEFFSNSNSLNARNEENSIEINDLSFNYARGSAKNSFFLGPISIQIRKGTFTAIIGENGSGKSTFLKLLMGLLQPSLGSVKIAGKSIEQMSIAERSQLIGYVFQNPSIQFFRDTVFDEFNELLKNHHISTRDRENAIHHMLDQFELSEFAQTYPRAISLGQQQRTSLAMAMSFSPQILILDEPTHGMDARQKSQFFDYLRQYCSFGNTVILATHDIEAIGQYSDDLLIFDRGQLIKHGSPKELLDGSFGFSTQIAQIGHSCDFLPTSITTLNQLEDFFADEE